jgi:hypothetical protein
MSGWLDYMDVTAHLLAEAEGHKRWRHPDSSVPSSITKEERKKRTKHKKKIKKKKK